jgi:sterol desaturase/sphingolipid hydroxylase (fatty acid hydroxylase superfamily)
MELKDKPHAKGTGSLFRNKLLERLTRTHIAVPLVLFSLISTGLIIYGIKNSHITSTNEIPIFLIGFFAFTLVEYLMHRFLFHLKPTNVRREKFTYAVHGVHHDYPKDKDRLAMPIPMSITLAVLFFLFFRLILGKLVFAFLPGFFVGYAYYL